MRRMALGVVVLGLLVLIAVPQPAAAEIERAVVAILGGMQCSL